MKTTFTKKAQVCRNVALTFAVVMAVVCGFIGRSSGAGNTYTREDPLAMQGMAPDGTYVSCSQAEELTRGLSYLVVDPETGNYETAEIAEVVSSETVTVQNQDDGSTQRLVLNTLKAGGASSKTYKVLTPKPLRMETSMAAAE